jgi:hypothetical protein
MAVTKAANIAPPAPINATTTGSDMRHSPHCELLRDGRPRIPARLGAPSHARAQPIPLPRRLTLLACSPLRLLPEHNGNGLSSTIRPLLLLIDISSFCFAFRKESEG